jgi:hypothetical protein
MKIRGLTTGILALVVVGAAALVSAGDEKKAAAPAMDEKTKAMMAAWEKAGTPGEAHKKLEPFVGTFDTKVKTWMAPGAPPEESVGVSESRWVLENRFVETRFQGSMMGQPFSGLGYTGYDNIKKKYIGSWMDSMGTSMMTSLGDADAAGKVMTFEISYNDAVTGKPMTMKQKMTVTDNDHHMMEMWGPSPDGKVFKMMEISYMRKM